MHEPVFTNRRADPAWADDGWQLVDFACERCGATITIHDPHDERVADALDLPEGVIVECSACQAKIRLGGVEPAASVPFECGNCHRTFEDRETDAEGGWVCECGTRNRHISASDAGTSTERAVTG